MSGKKPWKKCTTLGEHAITRVRLSTWQQKQRKKRNYTSKLISENKITGKSAENKSLKRKSVGKSRGKKCTTFSANSTTHGQLSTATKSDWRQRGQYHRSVYSVWVI